MNNLKRYFSEGITDSALAATSGTEIETHFVNESGEPIEAEVTNRILGTDPEGRPWNTTLDLGRQLIELRTDPQKSLDLSLEVTQTGLDWLYSVAEKYGAYPVFEPVLDWDGPLLWTPDGRDANADRDTAFVRLDGREALEELCRIAAVQFTLSVPQEEAIEIVNTLLTARLQERDYPNEANWRRYIQKALAGYAMDRYGGPEGFEDLDDYVSYVGGQSIIMRDGQICEPRQQISDLGDSREGLTVAVRNVWNYIRLRRYGNTLTVEIRPIARGTDSKIKEDLDVVRGIIGA